jgi:hypothetical protein
MRRVPNQHIDLLDTESEVYRRAFAETAKAVGSVKAGERMITGHILHTRPLVIGTASDAE